MEYLQCSVFTGACAIISSKLVVPCDANGACEFWSSAQGCRPVLDHSCIAAGASFEWVIFTNTAHLALVQGFFPSLAFSFVD